MILNLCITILLLYQPLCKFCTSVHFPRNNFQNNCVRLTVYFMVHFSCKYLKLVWIWTIRLLCQHMHCWKSGGTNFVCVRITSGWWVLRKVYSACESVDRLWTVLFLWSRKLVQLKYLLPFSDVWHVVATGRKSDQSTCEPVCDYDHTLTTQLFWCCQLSNHCVADGYRSGVYMTLKINIES